MRKYILIAITVIASANLAKAQSSFLLTDPNTSLKASHNYTFWLPPTGPTTVLEFPVKNISASSKASRIHKAIITNTSGQDVYFCYASNCYTPFTFYTPGAPIINAGQTFPTGSGTYGLRTEFDPNGVLGTSIVRYTVYDSLNHGDSVNVTISYNVTPAGIQNSNNNIFISNPSPNPANTLINFTFELGDVSNDANVKIFNILGNLVKTVSLSPSTKNIQLDVSNLEEGVYFYSFVNSGKTIVTRRLLIAR